MEIFNKIKKLCEEHNISIFELENQIGISRGVLYTWKKSIPSIEKVYKVAKYFNVSIDYLVDHQIKGQNILHITDSNDRLLVNKYLNLTDINHKNSVEQLIDEYKDKELQHMEYENRLLEFINSSDSIKKDIKAGKIKLPTNLLSRLKYEDELSS